ncbi:unnamed protein product, partial [Ilex paraguariensis]
MQIVYTLTKAVALAIKAETQLDRLKSTVVARNSFYPNRVAVNKGKAPITQPPLSNTTRGTSSDRGPTKPANAIPHLVILMLVRGLINAIDADSQGTVPTSVLKR